MKLTSLADVSIWTKRRPRYLCDIVIVRHAIRLGKKSFRLVTSVGTYDAAWPGCVTRFPEIGLARQTGEFLTSLYQSLAISAGWKRSPLFATRARCALPDSSSPRWRRKPDDEGPASDWDALDWSGPPARDHDDFQTDATADDEAKMEIKSSGFLKRTHTQHSIDIWRVIVLFYLCCTHRVSMCNRPSKLRFWMPFSTFYNFFKSLINF